jgi:uncharacterized protein (TIRG00374 family)
MTIHPKVIFLLKALVTSSCLIFIFKSNELELIFNNLIKLDWLLLSASVLLFLFVNFITAWRWQILLNASQHKVPLLPLSKYYFIGAFFSVFLPTSIGGDLARWYYLQKYGVKRSEVISSILYERFLGVLTLATLSLSIFIFKINLPSFDYLKIAIIFVFFICIFTLFLFTNELKLKIFNLTKISQRWPSLSNVFNNFKLYTCNLSYIVPVLLISIFAHLVAVISIYLLSLSLDLDIALIYFIAVLPLAWLLTMLPISIGGIGVREGAVVFLLVSLGFKSPDAIAISVLMIFQILVQTILGGIMYLSYKYNLEE